MQYQIFEDLITTWERYHKNGWLFSLGIVLYYLAYLLLRYGMVNKKRRKKIKPKNIVRNLIALWLLAVYVFFVINLTFFSREPGSRGTMNLELLQFLNGDGQRKAEAVENFLLLLPCGVILPLINRACRKWYIGMWLGFVISFCIESIQLATGCGYFELDDILLNGLGYAAGYGMNRFLSFLFWEGNGKL